MIKSKKMNFKKTKSNQKNFQKTKKKFMKGGDSDVKYQGYNAPKVPKAKWYTKISRIWKSPKKVAIEKERFKTAHKIKIGVAKHEAVNLHQSQLQKVTLEHISHILKKHDKNEKLKQQQLQIIRKI